MFSPRRWRYYAGAAAVLALTLAACSSSSGGASTSSSNAVQAGKQVRVGLQINIFSQAFRVLTEQKDLVKQAGGDFTIKWVQTTSGPALNSALAAGALDAGFMAGPPFLIDWSKNLPVKIASDAGIVPIQFVVHDPKLQSLKDLPQDAKIALPAPGSFQDIILQMGSEKELGNSQALTGREVAMPQDVAEATLLSGQSTIVGFLGAPPYTTDALAHPGFHSILDAKDVFGGGYPFQVMATTENFHSKQAAEYDVLVKALALALGYAQKHPDETAALLHKDNPKLDEAGAARDLKNPDVKYSTVPTGLMKVAEFMHSTGRLTKLPSSVDELLFPNLQGKGAS